MERLEQLLEDRTRELLAGSTQAVADVDYEVQDSEEEEDVSTGEESSMVEQIEGDAEEPDFSGMVSLLLHKPSG